MRDDRRKFRDDGAIHRVPVAGLPPAFSYGWRVDGPRGPGHCFDPSILLFDPACTALTACFSALPGP